MPRVSAVRRTFAFADHDIFGSYGFVAGVTESLPGRVDLVRGPLDAGFRGVADLASIAEAITVPLTSPPCSRWRITTPKTRRRMVAGASSCRSCQETNPTNAPIVVVESGMPSSVQYRYHARQSNPYANDVSRGRPF